MKLNKKQQNAELVDLKREFKDTINVIGMILQKLNKKQQNAELVDLKHEFKDTINVIGMILQDATTILGLPNCKDEMAREIIYRYLDGNINLKELRAELSGKQK